MRSLPVLVLSVLVGALGCSLFTYRAPSVSVPASQTDRIPVTVGLFISPDMCSQERQERSEGETWRFQFGASLCEGIPRMVRNVFARVMIVPSIEAGLKMSDLTAVIVPEVVTSDMRMGAVVTKDISFLIRVKYAAVAAGNRELWADTYEGQGTMPAAAFHEVYTECMRRALEEHFRKAFAGLLASRWWKDAGNPNE